MNFNKKIDYRSDTVTQPTAEMREAMFRAQVGDDVYGEDPTIRELEHVAAERFGFESGLFCPSGTMTNQIALMLHTRPGDEVICEWYAHIYQYEGGGMAANAGIQPQLLMGDRGRISLSQIQRAVQPDDVHKGRTRLVSLENTSNRGGGSCYELSEMEEIQDFCKSKGIAFHLDGARIVNAIVHLHQDPKKYGELFDTVSVCLSKGLGAPVGSVLLGSQQHIHEARRIRKRIGGGMRQAGFLAAAGLYALENHWDRVIEDHENARRLERELTDFSWVESIIPVETNIVIVNLQESLSAVDFCAKLKEKGVLCNPISDHQIRFITHLDVHREDIEATIGILKTLNP